MRKKAFSIKPLAVSQRISKERTHRMRGVALIIVLLVVAIMTVTIVEFSYSTRVDLHSVGNMRDDAQVGSLARAGMELAEGIIKFDFNQQAAVVYYVPGADVDYTMQIWSQVCKFPPIPLELDQGLNGEIRGVITDEGGKIPLNLIVDPNGEPPNNINPRLDEVLRRLFVVLGTDSNYVDAIEDFIDADSVPRTYGAEGSKEYIVKNMPLDTVSELRMVAGLMTEDKDGRSPYQRLMERVSHTGDEDPGLCALDAMASPYLTVYPLDFTTTATINVNTASLEVIMALFDVDEADAEDIIKIRETNIQQKNYSGTIGAIAPPNTRISPKVWNEVYPLLGTSSSYFSIRALAQIPNPAAGEDEESQKILAFKSLRAVVRPNPQAPINPEILYYRKD